MKILILHTRAPDQPDAGRLSDEFDLVDAAAGLGQVLPGAAAVGVTGTLPEILCMLEQHAPDVVVNLCEAPLGRPDLEAHVAAILEWLGIRFTGCGSETLALCRRKDRANAVLAAAAVPIPLPDGFPCIVKPADEDGSAYLDHESVCHTPEQLAGARSRIPGRAIVQRFVPGREFAISLWGHPTPDHASIGETLFEEGLLLNTYAAKWQLDSPDFANSWLSYEPDIAPAQRAAILEAARGAWHAVGARHYLRVDVRLDIDGRPCVLDVNPNPELGPGRGIYRGITEAGWTWERFVGQLIQWA